MPISRKKIKQAKRLYPAKPLKEIADMLDVDLGELTRALRSEGVVEFKQELPEPFPAARIRWHHLLLLGLVVAIVYLNSLENTFHYDDYHSLLENIYIRKLSNIPDYFVNAQTFSSKPGVKMVRPLLIASFAINYALTEYNAWSWELVNILIHLLNVLLVYLFLVHLTGSYKFSVLSSLVFALHPTNTEAVNYINCRSTLLVSTFMLLSLYGFVRSILTRSRVWLVLTFVFFALGFLFKEEAIVIIALALVIDVLFLWPKGPKNIFERLLYFYLPFLVVIVIYFFYRQDMMGVWVQTNRPRSFLVNLTTESRVIVRYFNLLVWPIHLNTSYDVEEFTSLIKDKVGFAILYLGAWLAAAVYLWRKFPVFTLFVLWFFITLAPTALIPLNATMNEHRLYLPSLGFGVLLAYVLMKMGKDFSPIQKHLLRSLLILVFGLWSLLVVSRNRYWLTDMILWRDAITKSPGKAQVISDLGNAYFRKRPPDIDRAEQLYKWAVAADATYFKAYHNLAIINFSRGDKIVDQDEEGAREYYRKSVELFRQAVAIYPWNPDSWNDMGTAYLKLNDFPNAEENYLKAIKLDPNYYKGFYNLAYALSMEKRYADAEPYFIGALRVYDRDPKVWFALANCQFQQKKYEDALESLRQAMEILPEDVELKKSYDRFYKFIQDLKTGAPAPPP